MVDTASVVIVGAGHSGFQTAKSLRDSGFTGAVTLSVSGLPTGATGNFSPNPATGSSTLTVSATASTPAGTFPLTITGVSGSLTHTATVSLVVNVPDFSLSATPPSQTVAAQYTSRRLDPLVGLAVA